jgi:hypothetical protein
MSLEDVSDVVFEEEGLRFVQLGRISASVIRAAAQRGPHAVLPLDEALAHQEKQQEEFDPGILWQNLCTVIPSHNVLLLASTDRIVRLPLLEVMAAARRYHKPETLRENPFPELEESDLGTLVSPAFAQSDPLDTRKLGLIADLQVSPDNAAVAVYTTAHRSLIYAVTDLRLVCLLPPVYDRLWCWIAQTRASALITRKADRRPVFCPDVFQLAADTTTGSVVDDAETQALVIIPKEDILLSVVVADHQWLCVRFAIRRCSEKPMTVTMIEKLDQIPLQTRGTLNRVCRLQPLNISECFIAFTERESPSLPANAVQFAMVRFSPIEASPPSSSAARSSQITSFRTPHWIHFGEVCPLFVDATEDKTCCRSYLVTVPEWRICICALAPSDELELIGDIHWGQSSPEWRILRIADEFRAQLPEFDNSQWVRILGIDWFYDRPAEQGNVSRALEPVLVVFTNNGLVHFLRICGRANASGVTASQRVWARVAIPELIREKHRDVTFPPPSPEDVQSPQQALSSVYREEAPPRVDMSLSETIAAAERERPSGTVPLWPVSEHRRSTAFTSDNDIDKKSDWNESLRVAEPETLAASHRETVPVTQLHSTDVDPFSAPETSLPDLRAILCLDTPSHELPEKKKREQDDFQTEAAMQSRIREQQRIMVRNMAALLQQLMRLVDLFDEGKLARQLSSASLQRLREDPLDTFQKQLERIHEHLNESKERLHECASSLGILWTRLSPLENQLHWLLGGKPSSTMMDDTRHAASATGAKMFAQHLREIERHAEQVQEAAERLERWLATLERSPMSSTEQTQQSVSRTEAAWRLRHQYGERLRQMYQATFRCTMASMRMEREWEKLATRAQQLSVLLQDEALPASRLGLQRILDQAAEGHLLFSQEDGWTSPKLTSPSVTEASGTSPTAGHRQFLSGEQRRSQTSHWRVAFVHRMRQALRRQALTQGRDAIGLQESQSMARIRKTWDTTRHESEESPKRDSEQDPAQHARYPHTPTRSVQDPSLGGICEASIRSELMKSSALEPRVPVGAHAVDKKSDLSAENRSVPPRTIFPDVASMAKALPPQTMTARELENGKGTTPQGLVFGLSTSVPASNTSPTSNEICSVTATDVPLASNATTQGVDRKNANSTVVDKPAKTLAGTNRYPRDPNVATLQEALPCLSFTENGAQSPVSPRDPDRKESPFESATSAGQPIVTGAPIDASAQTSAEAQALHRTQQVVHSTLPGNSATAAASMSAPAASSQDTSEAATVHTVAAESATARTSADSLKPIHPSSADMEAAATASMSNTSQGAAAHPSDRDKNTDRTAVPVTAHPEESTAMTATTSDGTNVSIHQPAGPVWGMSSSIHETQGALLAPYSTSATAPDPSRPVFGAPSPLGMGFGFGNLSTSWNATVPTMPTTAPVTFGQSLSNSGNAPLTFGSLAQTNQRSFASPDTDHCPPGGFGAFRLPSQSGSVVGFADLNARANQSGSPGTSGQTSGWFGAASSSMSNGRPMQ